MKKSYKAPEIQTYVFETKGALLNESNIPVNETQYDGKFNARGFEFDDEEEDW